jgi:DNA-binding transcriptional MerR regulator
VAKRAGRNSASEEAVRDDTKVVRAFSADHVQRLTGLSAHQLRYWDKTGFFQPEMAFENRRSPYSRIYSFKDVVGLRVLSVLRHDHKVPLRHLREVAKELAEYSEAPWADLVLYVFNRQVHFREPETGRVRGVLSGQYVTVPLVSVMEDVGRKAEKLKQREPAQIGQIERHRFIARNAWVVAGTRIPVNAIRRFSEAGYSPEQIMREYPLLTENDVKAALAHT